MARISRTGYLSQVKEFIDIVGASGSVYRFRRVGDLAQLPAKAGNFLSSRPGGHREEVVCCGTALNLARAETLWKVAAQQHQAAAIFVRLNVSRTARASEHDDIVESQKPAMIVADVG